MYTGRGDYVDTKKTNEMLQGLAEGGFQIGALAQVIYAKEAKRDGVAWREITGAQNDQIESTRKALEAESITLLEATLQVGHFLVRVDVLRKRGNRIDLIEVKSKSVSSSESEKSPLRTSDYLPYLQDIAFQTMVAQQAYPKFEIHSFLMMPDKAKVTRTSNLHKLFPVRVDTSNGVRKAYVDMPIESSWADIDHDFMREMNVDKEVGLIMKGVLKSDAPGLEGAFTTLANQWAVAYANQESITPTLGSKNCGKCEFYCPTPDEASKSGFHECWGSQVVGFSENQTRESTVLGLYNDRNRLKKVYMEREKYFLTDIQQPDLGWEPISGPISNAQRQWMQVSNSWPGGSEYYFDQHNFAEEQSKWTFPYYFLDFEGARSALPFRAGQRPNGINAFQYSLHVMQEDGHVEHASQFLELEQGNNPNVQFLRHLRESLGTKGTVFRWHDYERSILNELRKELVNAPNQEPDYADLIAFIDSLVDEQSARCIVDQSKIADMFYFHPDTRGSSSIKRVLPAIMGSNPWLRERYSQAIYGGNGAIKSLNYDRAITWWREDPAKPGKAIDPYELLAEQYRESNISVSTKLCEEAELGQRNETSTVQNGGAAMMAYTYLQSGLASLEEKTRLKEAMLRYCELDTLAMVMIMQGFLREQTFEVE